jgi:hypothetical protein
MNNDKKKRRICHTFAKKAKKIIFFCNKTALLVNLSKKLFILLNIDNEFI